MDKFNWKEIWNPSQYIVNVSHTKIAKVYN